MSADRPFLRAETPRLPPGCRPTGSTPRTWSSSEFEKDPELSHVGDLFTVDLITRYILGKVGADNEAT
jgi:hypothetical protein